MTPRPIGPDPLGPLSGAKGPAPAKARPAAAKESAKDSEVSFGALLRKEIERADEPVRLSAHAQERLRGQGIDLTAKDLTRLASAVDEAKRRGSKDSLVVMKNVGLVVNITNRTVLTAIDPDRMKRGIVTGIDSTVFVEERKETGDSA